LNHRNQVLSQLIVWNTSFKHNLSEEPLLVEAEQLYEKMLENITNKIVTSLSGNTSSAWTIAQQELFGKQAFHPNFDRNENNMDNTTNKQVS
jgi:hypothetical protein